MRYANRSMFVLLARPLEAGSYEEIACTRNFFELCTESISVPGTFMGFVRH